MSFVAQSARGLGLPAVPQKEIDKAKTIVERFMIRWRGEPDPKHVKAVDAYFVSAAEHGMNASTFTARVVASTGADVAASISAAIGALSGPLHGGAPSRVLKMLDEVEASGDPVGYVKGLLDRKERLMGFGHRVYRAEDPRARTLRRTAQELGSRRVEAAEALEKAAIEELTARYPDRPLRTNVEFWSAVVLDFAEVPPHMFTSMFTCARTAGWSAHILEQKRAEPADPPVGAVHRTGAPPARGRGGLRRDAPAVQGRHRHRRGLGRRPRGRAGCHTGAVTDASIVLPDADQAPRRPLRLRPVEGAPRGARLAGRTPARRSWAPRTGRLRCGASSAGCATGCGRCSSCRTGTRWCSATAGRPPSGTRRRTGWSGSGPSTSCSASSPRSSPR